MHEVAVRWGFFVTLLAIAAGFQFGCAIAKDKAVQLKTDASVEIPTLGVLDLNSASEETLATLPGLSAAGAKSIIGHRPYTSIEDFVSRGIVSMSDFEKFRDGVMVVVIAREKSAGDAAQ